MTRKISAISCGKLDSVMAMPGLLDIQTNSFAALLRRDEDAERAQSSSGSQPGSDTS